MNEFEETVSYRFAAFCVKVLRISARRCYEEIGRRNEKEMSLSLLCENALDYLITEKKYFGVSHHFSVNGYLVSGMIISVRPLNSWTKSIRTFCFCTIFWGLQIKRFQKYVIVL